ncbi:FtsX-like permease family protein [Kitasatospora phosalacinea]|uniref:FtsX-like permease family protein n=1 Tax=Kitasatospora phosalacinea TaxID=2065 RepID=UPI00365D9861
MRFRAQSVLGVAGAQLRFRPGRAVALTGALTVAVTSFAVLTATADVQRLNVTGTVNGSARGAYDLLVRPAGATSALEARDGLVSSTALAALSGGITEAQWKQVLATPDIAVAAPVAVVGYFMPQVNTPVDVSAHLAPDGTDQVLRLTSTLVSEQGLTAIPDRDSYGSADSYVYVTGQPLRTTPAGPALTDPSGASRGICGVPQHLTYTPGAKDNPKLAALSCGSTNADDGYNAPGGANPKATGNATRAGTTRVPFTVPYLVQAVDPQQEALLAGLDGAVSKGSYFTADQAPAAAADPSGNTGAKIPVLVANRTAIDEKIVVTVARMHPDAAADIASGADARALFDTLPEHPATTVGTVTVDAQQAYRQLLDSMERPQPDDGPDATANTDVTRFLSALPITYTDQDGSLAAQPLAPGSNPLPPPADSFLFFQPDLAQTGDLPDTAVRALTQHTRTITNTGGTQTAPTLDVVGEFDPDRLTAGNGGLGAVPMETYFPAAASGADAASTAALGGRNLLPNGNIRGLLSVPPSMITTLSALPVLTDAAHYGNISPELGVDAAAPISVIRVRLGGDLGTDALSRERVRLAAQRIHDRTGLDVDVTMGSSPTPVTVVNPAGAFGRPQLALAEMWTRKGVAAAVLTAIDRKSLLLVLLVLGVCALFVGGATGAAVRSRRRELAVLACLGWPARRLFAAVLTEVSLQAAAAGLLGALLTGPVGHLAGVHTGTGRALTALPAALALALLSAARPAWQAARAHPGEAVRATASAPRRPVRLRGVTGLALANLRRMPGRSLLGTASLALGTAAVVGVAGIATAFHGAVTGSLLGDAVSLQVRGTDLVAAVLALLLGLFTVADITYLNIRDRAAEFALLRATGWRDSTLRRLVLTETAVLALTGAGLGAAAAVAAETAFAGSADAAGLYPLAAALVAGAVLVATAAAAIPAAATQRGSAARALAEE